jgi:anti-anti-sigma regulatory factor
MGTRALVLDCAALANPDCATIDQIARLQLEVRRCGLELLLRNTNDPLRDLIGLAGLADVLRVEPGRQSEEREQPCCVEEERQLDDPPA